jgi:indole-3-glycerol phosphate synthase/phosphoribosylanthranilate isomerase
MSNILQQIVKDKYLSVAQLKIDMPLASFINGLSPSTKDMYGALRRKDNAGRAGFILECKKASPSKGLIRDDFDVKAICQTYAKYAAAISVLTDEKYFQGSYQDLKIVTASVPCPVLNKDFFIDIYQVHLARYYGADAILLMLSVLNDDDYIALASIAKKYNMAVLTEVSNQQECERAIALDAQMIGINNRNLRDLSTDITRTFEFAPSLGDERILISESGIYNHNQVRQLAPAVDGFLVGSSIMGQSNIDHACRELIYGNNKVCGLTTSADALAAADAGACFGGLIFADRSPRKITPAQAQHIIEQAPNLCYVGVFVDQPLSQLTALAQTLKLSALQLHGNEDKAYINQLKQQLISLDLIDCQVWKALAVTDQLPALALNCDRLLLDGKNPGSGQSFNWQVLNESEQDVSGAMLAGGLNLDNIECALTVMHNHHLFGVDLNSGVETSPGIKSKQKLNQVFELIRQY